MCKKGAKFNGLIVVLDSLTILPMLADRHDIIICTL